MGKSYSSKIITEIEDVSITTEVDAMVSPSSENYMLDDPRLTETKTIPEIKQKNKEVSRKETDNTALYAKIQTNQIVYRQTLYQMGEDTLQIGDLIFAMPTELTPPVAIRVDKQVINYKWLPLRSEDVKKISSGHSNTRISMSLYFIGLHAINTGLRRLIATFNATPFVYIENKFLRSTLSPSNDRNMACTLVSLNVRTEPTLTDVLVADLNLLWFNYQPYAKDFLFRKTWNSTLQTPAPLKTVYTSNTDCEIPSSQDIKLLIPISKKESLTEFSALEVLPQYSEPYVSYISRYENASIHKLSNKINITYKQYQVIVAYGDDVRTVESIKKPQSGSYLRNLSTQWIGARQTNVLTDVKLLFQTEMAERLERVLERFANECGRKLCITSGYRTTEDQERLRAKYPNSANEAGKSWHEVGLAVDIEIYGYGATNGAKGLTQKQFESLCRIARDEGLENRGKQLNRQLKTDPSGIANPLHDEFHHFQFEAGIKRYRSQYNNDIITTIAKLKEQIIGGLPGEINNEESVRLEKEKVKALAKKNSYDQKIIDVVNDFINQGYQVESSSDRFRLILSRPYTFSIEDQDENIIPQHIAIGMHNVIAEIPIVGHEYTTQQYLGGGDSDAQISLLVFGEDKVASLQIMFEEIQAAARQVRVLRDAAVIDIENSILNLAGFKSGLIEGVSIQNVEGSPGLYAVNLSITKVKRDPEYRALKQEKVIDYDLWRSFFKYIVENLMWIDSMQVLNLIQTNNPSKSMKLPDNLAMSAKKQALQDLARWRSENPEANTGIIRKTTSIAPSNIGNEALKDNVSVFASEDYVLSNLFLTYAKTYIIQEIRLYAAGIISTRLYNLTTVLTEDPVNQILLSVARVIADLVRKGAPYSLYEVLGINSDRSRTLADVEIFNQGKAAVQQLSGLKYSTNERDSQGLTTREQLTTEQLLEKAKGEIVRIFWQFMNQKLYYHPLFENFYAEHRESIIGSLRGYPCYPDLRLPPHPATNSELDTTPDFWFYNNAIDGAEFATGANLDLVGQTEAILANNYNEVKDIVRGQNSNYVSLNQDQIIKDIQGNKNIQAAAVQFDMSGMPQTTTISSLAEEKHLPKAQKTGEGLFTRLSKLFKTTEEEVAKGKIQGGYANTVYMDSLGNKIDRANFGGIKAGQPIDKNGHELPNSAIKSGEDESLKEVFRSSVANFDTNIHNLARAYPTFKIEFIEEDLLKDSGRLGIKNFDDFYSYSAIKDIRIVESHKMPASLCVVSIINISGELDTLVFSRHGSDPNSSANIVEKFDPTKIGTNQENPFSRLVLMEGSKIRVRLGYSNDSENLETLFIGQVVEVGVSEESQDIIQIICQSYGTELVAETLNSRETFYTTQELLSGLICSPSCVHFGHWSLNTTYDPDSVRTSFSGDKRWGFFGASEFWRNAKTSFLRRWSFLNTPQDDNIFAPAVDEYSQDLNEYIADSLYFLGIQDVLNFLDIFGDRRQYAPLGVTVWDVFKEMELRHPGYIAYPVPYVSGDESRYTMFFGPPSHYYWSRGPSGIESLGWQSVMQRINSFKGVQQAAYLETMRNYGAASIYRTLTQNEKYISTDSALGTQATVLSPSAKAFANDSQKTEFIETLKFLLNARMKRYKPFRNYHLLHSNHNIIANTTSASAHGTYNAVRLDYMSEFIDWLDSPDKDADQNEINRRLFKALQDDGSTLDMKADDNIQDKDLRVMQAQYPMCIGDYYARCYAVSLLMKSLRDVYKGHITILGNPKIKPYDIIYIWDAYRNMYGAAEVGQVTHIFSHETGYITEIKPDLITTHNSYTTQATFDAMTDLIGQFASGLSATVGLGTSTLAIAATQFGLSRALGVLTGGLSTALLWYGGYKLVQMSQVRQPIIVSPLIQDGKPFIAGLDGFKRDNLIMNINGKWNKFTDDVSEGWNDFWEKNTISKSVIDQVTSFIR